LSAKKNPLISAKRATVIVDTHGKSPPLIERFDYFFPNPVNEIQITSFLTRLVKHLSLSVIEIRFGPTRLVSKSRVWSKRKIEEDILNS